MKKTKNYGYCRVSTKSQEVEKQKHFLLNYAHDNNFVFEKIIEVVLSSRKTTKEREVDKLIELANNKITLHIIKDNIIIDPNINNPIGDMYLTLLSGFAQLERSFISERTKAGLEKAKAEGKMLGKPKGSISNSTQFEPFKEKIFEYLDLGLSYEKIVEIIGVGSKSSLYSFVKYRKVHL